MSCKSYQILSIRQQIDLVGDRGTSALSPPPLHAGMQVVPVGAGASIGGAKISRGTGLFLAGRLRSGLPALKERKGLDCCGVGESWFTAV